MKSLHGFLMSNPLNLIKTVAPNCIYCSVLIIVLCGTPASMTIFCAGTWLFVDETLVRKKDSDNGDSDPPNGSNSSDSSSDPPYSNDSGIELLQPGTTDESSLLQNDDDYDEKEEEEMHLFEIDDSDSATDSDYVNSDTELLKSRRTKTAFDRHSYERYKRKCMQTFNIFKLPHLVMQRTVDCVGGFVACAVCIWTYDYTKCNPHNLQRKSSGCGQTLWRTLKLMLDRRVFLSVLLYGIIAFLAIISNEV